MFMWPYANISSESRSVRNVLCWYETTCKLIISTATTYLGAVCAEVILLFPFPVLAVTDTLKTVNDQSLLLYLLRMAIQS